MIGELTLSQLRERRLFGREDLGIPTLCEVLEEVAGRVPFLIEVKQPTLLGVGKLERLVSHHLVPAILAELPWSPLIPRRFAY